MCLHRAVGYEEPARDVLVAEALFDQSHHVQFGWRQRGPATARSLALAATPLCVRNRLLCRQGGTLCPCRLEVLLAHRLSEHGHRGFKVGIVDLEPNLPRTPTHRFSRP